MAMRRHLLARNQLEVLTGLMKAEHELAGVELVTTSTPWSQSSGYAALAALERDGLVVSHWDVTGKRPRKMFTITELGKQSIAENSWIRTIIEAGA
jgi:DNA-binding PadR family transcriptional regulator